MDFRMSNGEGPMISLNCSTLSFTSASLDFKRAIAAFGVLIALVGVAGRVCRTRATTSERILSICRLTE